MSFDACVCSLLRSRRVEQVKGAKFALDRVQLVPARHLQAGDEAVGSRIVAVRSSREKQRNKAKSVEKEL